MNVNRPMGAVTAREVHQDADYAAAWSFKWLFRRERRLIASGRRVVDAEEHVWTAPLDEVIAKFREAVFDATDGDIAVRVLVEPGDVVSAEGQGSHDDEELSFRLTPYR